jgi:TRAP-type mannitol/chloroaromatic compound transport system permease small subunit
MQKLLLNVDRLSTWIGKFFAWLIVALTLTISWEVFSRYVLGRPHAWMLDFQIMLYGTMFMMAGAYTLALNGHVRGDVLYGFFRPRTQAWIDLILYVFFFLPGVVAMTWAGITFAREAIAIREQTFSAEPLPIYPFKVVVPVAGAFLLLQGIVEMIRCVQCIRTGNWPSRIEDVEEVDVDKLRAMVHADEVPGASPAQGHGDAHPREQGQGLVQSAFRATEPTVPSQPPRPAAGTSPPAGSPPAGNGSGAAR